MILSPRDGAVDVPLNARLFVLDGDSGQPLGLRTRDGGAEVALAVVDVTPGSRSYASWITRPVAPLAPETAYEITQAEGGDTHVRATFTTGTATDTIAAAFAGAAGVTATRWRAEAGSYDSCWGIADGEDTIEIAHPAVPDDAVGVAIDVRLDDEATPSWRALRPVPLSSGDRGASSLLRSGYCDYLGSPALADAARACVRTTAFDLAGNQVADTAEACTTVRTCGFSDDGSCASPPGAGGCAVGAPGRTPGGPWGLTILCLGFTLCLLRRAQGRGSRRGARWSAACDAPRACALASPCSSPASPPSCPPARPRG